MKDEYDVCMTRIEVLQEQIVVQLLKAHIDIADSPCQKKMRKALIKVHNYFTTSEEHIHE